MAMASSSSSSVSRPQAGPLPTKRGEIGFREDLSGDSQPVPPAGDVVELDLPPRHPADSSPISIVSSTASTAPHSSNTPAPSGSSKPKCSGISISTLIVLLFQCVCFLFTIAIWVVVIKFVFRNSQISLMIHIPFAIGIVLQILFLERTVFRARAERYVSLHPGEIIPPSLLHPRPSGRLAIVPWNRPSLPDYAAVLAETGVGTGDVEDNRIAIPPPPAYGITRGSTLVLAGFISEEMRNESRRVRVERGERLSDMTQKSESRPMTYMSQASESEARCDAVRARILEETLNRLQSSNSS